MDDIEKTMVPRREIDGGGTDDLTMPGRRDRKNDGRFQIGDLIMKRYKVLAELGQGGMGVVYKCFDETAGIEIALKALPPELSHNSLEMEDIKDNFQLIAKLVHQNIAIYKNLERDDSNGNYYLIMECCEGEDLRRWIKRKRKEKPLDINDVLPIIKQVAGALDYAHEQKIIHRDIKPGNIMINASGDIKVLDFGLAAQIHTSMTRVSMAYHGTSGTGPYMAPEQWRGRAQGAAADQYALAVMAYEMLAGFLPFESSDAAVLREAVLNDMPEDITGITKSAHGAIKRAMSKDPAGRFNNCSDFAAALGGKKIKKTAPQSKSRSPKWVAGIIIAALLGAGGAGYYFFDKQQNEQARIREAEQKKNANITKLFAAAQAAQNRSDWKELLKLCQEILKIDRKHQGALSLRAQAEKKITMDAERKRQEQQLKDRIATLFNAAQTACSRANWQEVVKICGQIEKLDGKHQGAIALGAQARREIVKAAEQKRRDEFQQENYRLQPIVKLKKTEIDSAGHDRNQTFGKYLDAVAYNFAAAERAERNKDPIAANAFYKAADKAADWIITNAPLRKEVRYWQKKIKEQKAQADKFDASKFAFVIYKESGKKVAAAEDDYASGDFNSALKTLKAAMDGYRKAFADSRSMTLKNLISYAKLAEKNKRWQQVMEFARKIKPLDPAEAETFIKSAKQQIKVEIFKKELAAARSAKAEKNWLRVRDYAAAALKIDSSSGAAKELKLEAERNLKPVLEIIATVDGSRVPAEIKLGNKTFNTLNRISGIAANKFFKGSLSYRSGEAEYTKQVSFNSNWHGLKKITVALKKISFDGIVDCNGIKLEMVKIKAGTFTMGSPVHEEGRDKDEKQHKVVLTKDFWLGKFEVTQAQYRAVTGNNPSYFKGDNRPVERVNWGQAREFCNKLNKKYADKLPLGYRFDLPTEAQWEYACRAGTETSLYNGKDMQIISKYDTPDLDEIGWYGGNCGQNFNFSDGYDISGWEGQYSDSRGGSHNVGTLAPNAWGLYDMLGNVCEWCSDWYGPYNGKNSDPEGASTGKFRVSRGGSWQTYAKFCRSGSRYGRTPEGYSFDIGFRLALVPVNTLSADVQETDATVMEQAPKPAVRSRKLKNSAICGTWEADVKFEEKNQNNLPSSLYLFEDIAPVSSKILITLRPDMTAEIQEKSGRMFGFSKGDYTFNYGILVLNMRNTVTGQVYSISGTVKWLDKQKKTFDLQFDHFEYSAIIYSQLMQKKNLKVNTVNTSYTNGTLQIIIGLNDPDKKGNVLYTTLKCSEYIFRKL